jgi:hypothetical protein
MRGPWRLTVPTTGKDTSRTAGAATAPLAAQYPTRAANLLFGFDREEIVPDLFPVLAVLAQNGNYRLSFRILNPANVRLSQDKQIKLVKLFVCYAGFDA